jgi:hypothetical protein
MDSSHWEKGGTCSWEWLQLLLSISSRYFLWGILLAGNISNKIRCLWYDQDNSSDYFDNRLRTNDEYVYGHAQTAGYFG